MRKYLFKINYFSYLLAFLATFFIIGASKLILKIDVQ